MAQEVSVNVPEGMDREEAMSLLDHLRELRDRLFKSALALAIGTGITSIFYAQLLNFIAEPLRHINPNATLPVLIATTPFESLSNIFTVCVTVGAALAFPVILYQIIAYIAPGLLDHEKRWLKIGFPFALILFSLGVYFTWRVFLPSALPFLLGFLPELIDSRLKLDEYIPFVMGMMFWMGLAFEMPLIMFVLAKANLISAAALRKNWRYAVVGISILAAVITPTPDPVNMFLVMLPLLVLYVMSIGMAYIARRGVIVPAMIDTTENIEKSQ
ncbi:MAG: twin-arginine translocase subunit TatC [Chloroflexi bacterium]|jgi:sec-independent protein translocase protein TatC|nr:twin-arginine translocase subunit TatC [Chloroflexota bacterium]